MSLDNREPDDIDIDIEEWGVLYSSLKMKQWESAYTVFEDFITQSKKEFVTDSGNEESKSSVSLYEEMIEESLKAIGSEESAVMDEHEIHQAFMYGANEEPELMEFKETVENVLSGRKSWEGYALDSYE